MTAPASAATNHAIAAQFSQCHLRIWPPDQVIRSRGPAGDVTESSRQRLPGDAEGGGTISLMPLYKEQGVVLSRIKLGEADRIVTILTQGSGKVRAVAKGIRRTKSKFGARLEPFTHVSLMIYRGRGALDTVAQAEIISSFRPLR